MIKIAIAQLNLQVADFQGNIEKILSTINSAKEDKVELVVFSELAIGGYCAMDMLRNHAFLDQCHKSIQEILPHTMGITCVIGAPIRNEIGEGKALFNAALVLQDGVIKHQILKRLLPDYDVFDEYRYFEPSPEVHCVEIRNLKVSLTVCEDLWDDDHDNSYVGDVMGELAVEKPDLVINIAASPFSYSHFDLRKSIFRRNALRANAPLIYLNQVGAYADLIFDGRSLVIDSSGEILAELKAFDEDYVMFEFDQKNIILSSKCNARKYEEIELIHDALIYGLKEFFQKLGFDRAVLGLSGGIDSALVLALACQALGVENVWAILMPSKYSTDHSIKDAMDLVNATGCKHRIISIEGMVNSFDDGLSDMFEGVSKDVTEENIQARIRATILMATSNKFGCVLLNTSNKSEAAVGYGTLYGDMAGSISVIGDLYKTQVYDMARFINRDKEIIPQNTINKEPSAELRPDQKDSDSLPDYQLLDSVLYQLIELEKSTTEVSQLGFDEAIVKKINRMLFNAEFKRYQAPPILRISSKAFGRGRTMPLVAKNTF